MRILYEDWSPPQSQQRTNFIVQFFPVPDILTYKSYFFSAYGLYLKSKDLPNQRHQQAQEHELEVKQFKRTLSRPNVRVHFIGALVNFTPAIVLVEANVYHRDTVSSIGFTKKRCLPETTAGMTHVCIFRHALALDELRVKFLPEYANGGGEPGSLPQVKEVWFAGSHSDVYVKFKLVLLSYLDLF